MKHLDDHTSRLREKPRRFFYTFCCFTLLCTVLVLPALADTDDPLTVVNNLSDLVFSIIQAIGVIVLGWGVVQIGLSFQSHDSSQRTNGFLAFAGGLLIALAKPVLDSIM